MRSTEEAVMEYEKTGRIVAKTGLVNLSGASSPLGGVRVFVESRRDKEWVSAPKIKRGEFLGMTLHEQAGIKKWCNTCKQYKPCTDEYWHSNQYGKFGLHSKCKECKAKYDKSNGKRRSLRKYQFSPNS